jgi:LAO/AO transport system kinase
VEEFVGDINDEHDDVAGAVSTIALAADAPKSLHALLADFVAGRKAALARAVSIVENHRDGSDHLLAACHPRLGRARRVGITGPPGAGKSTLTTLLAETYLAEGLTVGIVAVDPTSPFTGGALLGDRVRMERVALHPNVFIRSMATRGSLGGLAATTREVCDVLDAYGTDRILVETVGVGQSELDIARLADTSAVVLVPESGDSIQTLKAGVMEIADVFVEQGRPSGRRSPAQRRRAHARPPQRRDAEGRAGASRRRPQAREPQAHRAGGRRARRRALDTAGAPDRRRDG